MPVAEHGPINGLSEAHAPPDADVPDGLRAALLDPAYWHEGMDQFARSTRLAVALADVRGRLLGPIVNPQPLWTLLHSRLRPPGGQCPFALLPARPCNCLADALRDGRPVLARDRTGLAHFVVPLLLAGRPVAALLAGQVFDRYPEQLPLEQAAREADLAAPRILQEARREYPVSPAMLRAYTGLLATLGHTFLQTRYHSLGEQARAGELERLVQERTADLKQAQEKAIQAERLAAIGQMAAGLAHEGRNALQRSQGCLEILRLRLLDRPELLDLLKRLQRAQDDLQRLFEEVREYSAPLQLEREECDLAAVWREAWDDLERRREGRVAELREETGGVDLRCRVDPYRLKQVFRNLFDNALAACPDPVRLLIRATAAEREGRPAVQITVRDNGPGFTPGQRPRLFEPFHTTKTQGTGLGLAICKRLVEAHGGRIAVGTGPGSGAEILITLPR